jgi:BirA family biotin operon repressor/biotin-[acetyl-CoA-carboxylase] ligase
MSLLLRPRIAPASIFSLTMLTGSAIVAALERITGLRCDLKWPNDILTNGKKLGGILTEGSLTAEGIEFAVVGLGLNVNVDFAEAPELHDTATSLSLELGQTVSRVPVIQSVLEEFERRYELAQRGEHAKILEEWRARLATLGKQVVVTDGQWQESGLAFGVEMDGTLLLRRDDGSLVHVVTGDISLRESK